MISSFRVSFRTFIAFFEDSTSIHRLICVLSLRWWSLMKNEKVFGHTWTFEWEDERNLRRSSLNFLVSASLLLNWWNSSSSSLIRIFDPSSSCYYSSVIVWICHLRDEFKLELQSIRFDDDEFRKKSLRITLICWIFVQLKRFRVYVFLNFLENSGFWSMILERECGIVFVMWR
jgi:hypothetical protein